MTNGNPSTNPESRFITRFVNASARWLPVGTGVGVLAHFLLRQDWILALCMFPITLVTVVWAKYTENFVETIGASAGKRGKSDAIAFSERIGKWDKALRWRFSGADEQYL